MTTDLRIRLFHAFDIRCGQSPCERAFPDTFIAHDGNLQAGYGCCLQPQLESLDELRAYYQERSSVHVSTATALMRAGELQASKRTMED
jgi:hypothetical protein